MTTEPSRIPAAEPLRVDARNNRTRIVEAARDLFATQGLDVTMTDIARHSGVGVATLYRRFPTKDSLVTEAFAEQIELCASVVADALADPDPWRAFHTVLEQVCAMQAVDRGFTGAFTSRFPDSATFDQLRARAEQGFGELADRAKASGHLRADFTFDDITLLLMANGGIVADSRRTALAASRRLVALMLHAFRATGAEPLPPAPHLGLQHVVRPPAAH
ncbi:TetR/AcrR family transcriptional regulator [Umezawaea endophytica]|uniref:TetR/AcrR family transcriptional regulator n=1 Tax=Umezawaea endophytica TaxID=1654476 RepID=A0A9X2VQB1_9PSEU|nr:TetR/AcrR family transcriptional regulator [Umezawaea endophytica]MCS7479498.1 TetR/AcrR family transcriptional regulator [Umezawaea endophytica]